MWYQRPRYVVIMTDIFLRPDSKGRISLGKIANNVSSYKMTVKENGQLLLEPYVEIPLSDKWVFEDKDLIDKLKAENTDKQT